MDKRLEKRLRKAAQRGAAKLDELRPNWFNLISLSRLRLSSSQSCVAGQLLGLDKGSATLSTRERFWQEVNSGWIEAMRNYSPRFGFNWIKRPGSVSQMVIEQYAVLDDEWKKLIRERRRKAREAKAAA